jgi:hypothetical protein
MDDLITRSFDKGRCFDVYESAAMLRPAYRCIALVTHTDHVAAALANGPDGETLLVSSNWLLWHQCVQDGLPCIHANAGLIDWDASEISRDLFIEANMWIYHGGKDRTVFKGVSLGRKFASQSSLAFADYTRLSTWLAKICRTYKPQEIHAYGFRTDYGFLGPKWRNCVLRDVAGTVGAELVVHDRYFYSPDPDFPTNQEIAPLQPARRAFKESFSEVAKAVFFAALIIAGKARMAMSVGRPSVLSLVSQLTSIPMINEIGGRAWFMLMIAKWFPNKRNPKWMLKSIARGALPVDCPQATLTPADRAELDAIRKSIPEASDETSGVQAFMLAYARDEILNGEKIERLAAEVLWASRLLESYRPQQVLTDSLLNPVSGIIIDVAREMHIPVTVMLHAHYIQELRFERLGCDPRAGDQADRFFSWGPVTENWLRSTGGTAVPVRTGNPISGSLLSEPRKTAAPRGNVLLLQYTIAYSDFGAWPHHEYEFFVKMVHALNELGYTNVRLRLHPGVPKAAYYRDIKERFGLSCEINDSGAFKEHIAWADFVIGPVISGAMLEVMASGKHYYPVLMQPSSVDTGHVDGLECYYSSEEVADAIKSGAPGKQTEMLEAFTSATSHPRPAANIWHAIDRQTGIEGLAEDAQ